MKVAQRFEVLGDPEPAIREFEREAKAIVAEADRRLTLPGATKTLGLARERAIRNGLGLVRFAADKGSAVSKWGTLAAAIEWASQLEHELGRDAAHTFGLGRGTKPPRNSLPVAFNVAISVSKAGVRVDMERFGLVESLLISAAEARDLARELTDAAKGVEP